MFSFISRRLLIVATVFLSVGALTACGDKEPEQRKAFIEFLQKDVIPRAPNVIYMKDEQKKAFGPYADHYQLILDFNTTQNETTSVMNKFSALRSKMTNMQGIQQNWKEISELRNVLMNKVIADLKVNLEKIKGQVAALKQPDDLKPVFAEAFSKSVEMPASLFANAAPAIDTTMQALEALGKFLDDNKSKLTISGMTVNTNDNKLRAELQTLMNTYNQSAMALLQAMKPLMSMGR
ncbi:DUF3053 family protein [Microvirga sp. W0021]|uniref:DUF3053 family protein n=1 Tax=Hohaiivirga grylli TaxID=3133970 RepID=A0ABV0BKU7_9HYPH